MSDFYDRQGNPLTLNEWMGLWNEQNKRVAYDLIDGVVVSTVWLGTNHRFGGDGPPIIFETMVFGGELNEEQVRYSTEAEALAGHAEMVKRVKGES